MNIETYEIEEVKGEMGNLAADSEACELIKKLGLEGQQTLVDPSSDTRFPYPKMTSQQALVFSTCFPEVSDIKNFRQHIIPLRVLQVAAFCKDHPSVHHLEVWSAGSVKEDPILVARTAQYGGDTFLLARWGEALASFDALKKKSATMLRAKRFKELKKAEQDVKGALECVDSYVENAVETGDYRAPSFYI